MVWEDGGREAPSYPILTAHKTDGISSRFLLASSARFQPPVLPPDPWIPYLPVAPFRLPRPALEALEEAVNCPPGQGPPAPRSARSPPRGSVSLKAAHSRASTRNRQLAMTSGFIRMVWPMARRNMSRDVSVHTMRGFLPERISTAKPGSAIMISQASRTFNVRGDQVLSNSAVI